MTPRLADRYFLIAGLLMLLVSGSNTVSAQPARGVKRAEITRAALNVSALRPGDKAVLAVEVKIAEGFHAQSRTPSQEFFIKFDATLDPNNSVKFGEVAFPAGVEEEYPGLGKLNVYTGTVVVRVPVEVKADAKVGDVKITGKLKYQLCDDKSCFPPERPEFEVTSSIVASGATNEPANADLFEKVAPPGAMRSLTDYVAPGTAAVTRPTSQPISTSQPVSTATPATQAASASPILVTDTTPKWGALTAFGIAFVAGIMFNLVPCVLPVLPIKVLGFAEVAQHDRAKTLLLSGIFSLGIVSVFAVLAVIILVLKKLTWGEQFANPIFAWGIVILLLVLSLWMFGLINVNLPASAYSFTPRHDTLFGNYLWGILTAVLSTPCTGPLFPGVMIWAQRQPTAIGVPAFMMVGVGMAFPYLLLSAFPEAARKFPRVGPWAELFKQMLGFVLLAFTVFFAAGRFASTAGPWASVLPVAVLAAIYLMARTVQLSQSARAVAIASVIAVSIVTTSAVIAGKFGGFFDEHQPGSASSGTVSWTPYSDSALDAARKAGKIVLIKFTANWCLTCQLVEGTVYRDPVAITALRERDVVMLKADLTSEDAPGWPRLKELSATGGIPLTAIYSPGHDQPAVISDIFVTSTLTGVLNQIVPTTAK